MASRAIYLFRDYGGETSSVSFPMSAFTNEGTLRSALDAVSLGQLGKVTTVNDDEIVSSANATNPFAQVESGLRIHVSDNSNGETGYFTVPCPDNASLTLEGDSVVLADGGIMATLVTQLEANVISRDGNAITVTRAEIVGRNR